MFSGAGVFADGLMIALVVDGVIYLKADDSIVPLFEREGLAPFSYKTRDGKRTLTSYWRMPERLYDDPDELARMGARVARRRRARAQARAAVQAAIEADEASKRSAEASGDLGFGRGRELRIGLADHAVAAVALGRIEAGVGARDQRLRGVALARGGDAERDGDAAEVLAGRALHQLLATSPRGGCGRRR